jgi:protein-tyrosine phosphatase
MSTPLITVICTANVCRSPMGHAVVQAKAEDSNLKIRVNSCGVQALTGRRPDKEALGALARAGYSIDEDKRAEQLLMPQANAAQLMLVMENRHKQWIMQNFPAYSGKVWLMGHWNGQSEVADPIGQGPAEFDACLKVLESEIDLWLPKLRALL